MSKSFPICITCGTQDVDPVTGYCINGHDDWLEAVDDVNNFVRASHQLGMSIEELQLKLYNHE